MPTVCVEVLSLLTDLSRLWRRGVFEGLKHVLIEGVYTISGVDLDVKTGISKTSKYLFEYSLSQIEIKLEEKDFQMVIKEVPGYGSYSPVHFLICPELFYWLQRNHFEESFGKH